MKFRPHLDHIFHTSPLFELQLLVSGERGKRSGLAGGRQLKLLHMELLKDLWRTLYFSLHFYVIYDN